MIWINEDNIKNQIVTTKEEKAILLLKYEQEFTGESLAAEFQKEFPLKVFSLINQKYFFYFMVAAFIRSGYYALRRQGLEGHSTAERQVIKYLILEKHTHIILDLIRS